MSLTLRIVGLGQEFTLEVDPSTTISRVKSEVEARSDPTLPACYLRLIARGKKLEDDEATLSDLGIEHRTRLMLLHNASYAADREGFEAISAIEKEINELHAKADNTPTEVLQELATQLCCRLDGIDTHGSETLRALRKKAIEKADGIGRSKPDGELDNLAVRHGNLTPTTEEDSALGQHDTERLGSFLGGDLVSRETEELVTFK